MRQRPCPAGAAARRAERPNACPGDHPARPGVKVETPSVNPGWLVGLLLVGRLVLPRRGERCPRTGPGPEGSRGAGGAPVGTRSALDAGGSGPVVAGLPADRPNAAGCR